MDPDRRFEAYRQGVGWTLEAIIARAVKAERQLDQCRRCPWCRLLRWLEKRRPTDA